ncbi:MAG: TonB-dependent receptor domain-containing protein [Flammeovirgaceae bacterium]
MKHILPLLIFLFIHTISIYAQRQGRPGGGRERPAIGRLTGKIVDAATKEPVEYATVVLINMRDSTVTGGVTNGKGRFEISQIKLGGYHLKISFIGYETYTKTPIRISPRGGGIEQDLGTVSLNPSAAMMEAVEVTAERNVMELGLDRRVINVAKNIAAEGGTVNDILQNIPSVDVDIDGNISLRGSENVTVLIDGKPSGLTGASRQAILDQIPASTIDRIEVVTNPSAKYDPDGMSGIINIITKQNALKGLNGVATLNVGTRDKYNATGTVSYRKGKWNLSTNYSYRYDSRFRTGANLRENISDTGSTFLDQDDDGDRVRSSHLMKLGVDYSFNSKNLLSASALYSTNTSERLNKIQYQTLDQEGVLTALSFRDTESDSDRESIDLNIGYTKKFQRPQQQLTIEARHSRSPEEGFSFFEEQDYELDFTPADVDPFLQNNFSNNNTNVTTIQTDYVNPVNKRVRYELGYKSIIRTIRNDFFSQSFDHELGQYVSDDELNNEFEYREQVHAIYGMYTRRFGKLTAQAGIRLEQAYTDATLLNSNEPPFENDYANAFPSGFLSYEISKNDEIRASYSRRINRPRTRQLNPFINVADSFNIRQGNPFLQPEYINVYEVSYSHNWKKITVSSSVYWREINGMIRRFKTVDDEGVSTTTYVNLSGGRSYGAELIFTGKITKGWDLNVSGNIFKNEVDGSNVEADLNNEATSWSAKLTSTWDFKKDFQLQITGRYRAPFAITQGEILELYGVNAALRKKVLKGKGSVTLRVSDIFDNFRFGFNTSGENFNQQSVRKRESRIGYISFMYRFGTLDRNARRGKRGGNRRSGDDGGSMEID